MPQQCYSTHRTLAYLSYVVTFSRHNEIQSECDAAYSCVCVCQGLELNCSVLKCSYAYGHFLSTMIFPVSSYSCLDIHIC